MSEIDLIKRIERLENKIATLEETISTIELMEKSERIADYIKARKRIHNLLSLVNSINDEKINIAGRTYEEDLENLEKEKNELEERIHRSIIQTNSITFTELRNEAFFGVEECESGLVITEYFGFDTRIVIPPVLFDKKVVKIGKRAFDNSKCEVVFLPDTITEIEDEAFKHCSFLQEIVLSTSLKRIGSWAFLYCKSLKTITLPKTINYLGKECFMNSGIEEIAIPSGLHTVPEGCFFNCNLRQVILNEGVSVIQKYAFGKLSAQIDKILLKEIIFPESISFVDVEMFVYQKNPIQTKMVFLGKTSKWYVGSLNRNRINQYIVYCTLGSEILKSSKRLNYEVHPLNEYYEDK